MENEYIINVKNEAGKIISIQSSIMITEIIHPIMDIKEETHIITKKITNRFLSS